MKKTIITAMLAATGFGAWAQDTKTTYGEAFALKDVISAAQVASMVQGKDSAFVQTEGTVKEVCQAKGCWMKVDAGNGQEMLVRFKGYSFFMPKDAAGKKVVLKGKAFQYETSVAELRHYAEDAGKSKKEIASIRKPQQSVRFVADGVIMD